MRILALLAMMLVASTAHADDELVKLPAAHVEGGMKLNDALAHRRSVRQFDPEVIDPGELAQLLWAAQGITSNDGGHTAPSAGALYPLTVYAVDAHGVWRYRPQDHALERVRTGDRGAHLARAALGQDDVRRAPLRLVITAAIWRSAVKYKARAERYATLEAGHVAQNVLLECTALGLGAVPIGAFDDADVRRVLGISWDETPLYIIAIGHPR
jgi:SagB-type dehydrogenase family enzyme